MKKENFYILLLFVFLVSCSSSKEGGIIYNSNLRTINLDEIPKEGFLNASTLFKKVKPIILETREDVLIGKVGSVLVVDSFIVVSDDSPKKAIFVFDSEGYFLRRIGGLGSGPGEYINISDFTIDRKNREIYILDPSAHKINIYSLLSGEFIHSIELRKGRFPRHVQYTSNSLFVDANLKTEEQNLLYKIDKKDGGDLFSWLDADVYNRGWMKSLSYGYSFFFSRNTDRPKFVNLFMDTVMTVVNDTLVPFMTVKSERWVDTEELKKAFSESGVDADFAMKNKDRVFGMTALIECQDCIFFTIWDNKKMYSVYNSEDETKVFDLFKDDLVYTTDRFPINNMQCADSKGVYAIAYPTEFALFAGVDLEDIVNPEIERYDELISLPEDANPVLFYYELKEKGERFK